MFANRRPNVSFPLERIAKPVEAYFTVVTACHKINTQNQANVLVVSHQIEKMEEGFTYVREKITSILDI